MSTEHIQEKFSKRVRDMKLRQAMKSLASVGLTPEEVIQYVKENGFTTSEQRRKDGLSKHRESREIEQRRREGLQKAREAKVQKAKELLESKAVPELEQTPRRRTSAKGSRTQAKEATKALE